LFQIDRAIRHLSFGRSPGYYRRRPGYAFTNKLAVAAAVAEASVEADYEDDV